ncbi:MAG: DUF6116 family protein [Pseudomonadota bacterium]|nr:DUF6116 family protein [Pseudomonadota bacterium]
MSIFIGGLSRFFARLRAPVLFSIIALLFVFDVLVPDFVPFIDEILLAAGTVMLSRWKKPPESLPVQLPPR